MSFRDQLKGFVAPEKLADFDKVADALDNQLSSYDADIKKLKADLRAKDGIKPEDFARLEDENAELRKANMESVRALKKAEGEAKTAGENAAQFRERTHKLVRDEGLTKELAAVGVTNPSYLKAAHAILRDGVQVDDDKGEAFAIVTKDGKESRLGIADYVKAWAASDEAKNFIIVPGSSGGGATGGGGNPTGKTMAKGAFDALMPKDAAAFMASGGKLIE